MIIAQQKRKENICEYLLYMWQVEDLVRAAECRPERIDALIMPRYQTDEPQREAIRQWYYELADMMRTEGKQTSGHLDINRIVLMQLEELHRSLLADPNDVVYQGMHFQILPAVIQLRARSGGTEMSDLETCLSAVYGFLTLRLRGETPSQETTKSIKQISGFLALLSHKYQQARQAETLPEQP